MTYVDASFCNGMTLIWMLEVPCVTNLSSVYPVAWYPHVNWVIFALYLKKNILSL